jgi:hypothetical protein
MVGRIRGLSGVVQSRSVIGRTADNRVRRVEYYDNVAMMSVSTRAALACYGIAV